MVRHKVLSDLKPVGVIASISSGIQGLVWAVLYLLALLHHYCEFAPELNQPLTFRHYLFGYLQEDSRCMPNVYSCVELLGPGVLAPWLVLGIISNFLLLAASITLALVLVKCRKESCFVFVNTWICLSVVTFIIDAGLACYFTIDYFIVQDATCLNDRGLAGVVLAFLFFVSTRGIILTVANIAFTVFFITASIKLYIKYHIKNKEMDLISTWPSVSTENSSFDFYENKNKNELVGVLNPINEYPEYSAKGRWPTLRERDIFSPPIRAYNLFDFEVKNPGGVRPDSNISTVTTASNSVSTDTQYRSPTRRDFVPNQGQQSYSDDHGMGRTIFSSTMDISQEPVRPALKPNPPSRQYQPKRNPSQGGGGLPSKSYSKTIPSRLGPPPPPMPSGDDSSSERFPSRLNMSTASTDEQDSHSVEPDYTPPTKHKQFNTIGGANSGLQKPQLPMSLHEAIKNRPPLRPVLQRMKAQNY